MRPFPHAFALLLVAFMAGCAAVSKVETGNVVVRDRLVVSVDSAWNKFERGPSDNVPTWTIEGITIDALQFFVGIKDGQVIAPTPSAGKQVQPLVFKSSMQPAEVVSLFEGLFTRDGSTFTVEKLEPADFLDGQGFRVEYAMVRKRDDVRLRGFAYGAIRQGELFVVNYMAPRLGFYPKYAPRVESMIRTARVKI